MTLTASLIEAQCTFRHVEKKSVLTCNKGGIAQVSALAAFRHDLPKQFLRHVATRSTGDIDNACIICAYDWDM